MNETATAISQAIPRSDSFSWCPFVVSPATTTPVITLMTGPATSSRQRSGSAGASIVKSMGSLAATSSSTGRTVISIAK